MFVGHKYVWMLCIFSLSAVLSFVVPQKSFAANPTVINFQGKVVCSNATAPCTGAGTNVPDGTYTFDFVLYDSSTLGTPSDGVHDKWHELSKSVTVTNGVFQTNLGSATSFSGFDFNTNNNLYLAIRFNNDAQGYMSPRIQMTSVPYAFNADRLGGVAASGFVQLSPGAQQSGSIDISGNIAAGGNITAGTYNTNTFNGSSLQFGSAATATIQSAASQALTITSNATATWSTSAGNLTLQAAGTNTIAVDTAGAGTATIGSTNATTVTVGNTTAATQTTIRGGTGSGAVAIQTGTNGTISVGVSSANTINVGTGAFAHTIAIGTDGSTTQGVTVGSTSANSTTTINGGSTSTAISVQVASGGTISIGTAASTQNVTIGSATAGTIRVGQNGGTLQLDGTNFDVSTGGVVTLAGGQTADITTAGGVATATNIVAQPGSSNGASGTGASISVKGGDQTGAGGTGGSVTIQGGTANGASGTRTGGSVTINGGSGSSASGSISIGTATTASITIGSSTVGASIAANTVTSTGFAFGGTSTATVQSAASQSLNVTGHNNSTFSTDNGTLTVTGFGGFNGGTPDATGATNAVTIKSGNSTSSGSTGAVTLQSGNVTASGTAGTVTIDNGSGSTTGTPTVNLGTTSARAVNIGNNNATTVVAVVTGTGTSAFSIQAPSSVTYMKLDTSNGYFYVGSGSGTGTPIQLVLANKNSSGDPGTTTDGAMYYNSSNNKFRCRQNSIWMDCGNGFNTITKTGDQAATQSSTAFQNDTALVFSVNASTTYVFDAWIPVDDSNTTADLKYTFTVPTGATLYIMSAYPSSATAQVLCNISTSGQTCSNTTVNVANHFIQIRGQVTNGANAGSVQFQFAQNTGTPASFPVIKKGATLSWHQSN